MLSSFIKHTLYINLETRPDRRIHVEEQLASIGIENAQRFNAIRTKNGDGALGCSLSHLKCLEYAKKQEWEHVLIVEDDILFLHPEMFVKQMSDFFTCELSNTCDVVLVAGNNIPPYNIISDFCVQVSRCQTTTGYFIQSHYYDTLITNFRTGITKLLREPQNRFQYAIDKHWFQLQLVDKWYLITPLTVTQREDYSDIENKRTNYTNMMLDLNKERYIIKQNAI
jgi:GR25 family glycosyltransferase involved in LPS biosynthesis